MARLLAFDEGRKSETGILEKENIFLKGQVEMLKAENKRLLEMHCREKETYKLSLLEVQTKLVEERNMFRDDILELSSQLEALRESMNKMIKIRNKSIAGEFLNEV